MTMIEMPPAISATAIDHAAQNKMADFLTSHELSPRIRSCHMGLLRPALLAGNVSVTRHEAVIACHDGSYRQGYRLNIQAVICVRGKQPADCAKDESQAARA